MSPRPSRPIGARAGSACAVALLVVVVLPVLVGSVALDLDHVPLDLHVPRC